MRARHSHETKTCMTKLKGAAFSASIILFALLPLPSALAQRAAWEPGWGAAAWDRPNDNARSRGHLRDPRAGRVEVNRFVIAGPAAAQLGHGAIAVESASGDGPWVEQRAAYEAAVVDALVGVGYDTQHSDGPHAQMATLGITRQVLVPAEAKRSPVSGSAAMSVGTRGSAYGLAVNVDMTKPLPALLSTRLDARIVDKASGRALWEGYATIASYEGDDNWTDARIANKLARALFDNFPKADATVPAGEPVPAATTGVGD